LDPDIPSCSNAGVRLPDHGQALVVDGVEQRRRPIVRAVVDDYALKRWPVLAQCAFNRCDDVTFPVEDRYDDAHEWRCSTRHAARVPPAVAKPVR